MLILKLEKDISFYKSIIYNLRKLQRNYPIHVDIIRSGDMVYLMGLDDGFSVAFLYSIFVKAKNRGLRANIMYARYIDESWIPQNISKFAEKMLSTRLKKKEFELLKNISITENMISKWYK